MKTFRLTIGILVVMAALVFWLKIQPATQAQTATFPPRFQIIMGPLLVRQTFLLDTQTGKVWTIFEQSKGGSMAWRSMDKFESVDVVSPLTPEKE